MLFTVGFAADFTIHFLESIGRLIGIVVVMMVYELLRRQPESNQLGKQFWVIRIDISNGTRSVIYPLRSEIPSRMKSVPIMTMSQKSPPLKKVPAASQKFHAPQDCE